MTTEHHALESTNMAIPKMTRAHFELIAATIRSLNDEVAYGLGPIQREVIANRFAKRLAATNPNFDRERFIAAATRT